MRLFLPRFGLFPPTIAVLLGFAPWALAFSASPHGKESPVPKPAIRIDAGALGYQPPGSLYLLSRLTFSSLDFVDANHLLFTFHRPVLLRRDADESSSDDDQMIRAVILGLPGGNVEATADWRMHDHARYLWPIADGKFLVRQRNSFSLVDKSLSLQPFLNAASRVELVEVSPDGHTLLVESELERHTPEEHRKLVARAEEDGDEPPPEDTQITLVDLETRQVLTTLRAHRVVNLPMTSAGYLVVEAGQHDNFLLRFTPFRGQTIGLGQVASTCTPDETFLNSRVVMIASCGPDTPDLYLDTWSINGKKLWRGRRDGHSVWPTLALAKNGSRFALGLLQITRTLDLESSLVDEDVKDQTVQVFDVATGSLLLTTTASPILTAGQNFALSPDGNRLAVLRNGGIEIYDVPSAAEVRK